MRVRIHSEKEIIMKTKAIFLATILATIGMSTTAIAASDPDGASSGSKVMQYSSDAALTTKVKTALLAEKNLKSLDVHVVTHNGIVQLSGFVVSSAQIDQAVDVALHVQGVKDVQNDLKLKTSS
jgi:osmotically-inducible protein OsmY